MKILPHVILFAILAVVDLIGPSSLWINREADNLIYRRLIETRYSTSHEKAEPMPDEFGINSAITKAVGITNIERLPSKAMWLSATVVTNWHEWDNRLEHSHKVWWYDGFQNCEEHATHGYAIGEVRSNSVLNVVFNGKTNHIEQSSTIIGFLRRDWKLKPAERDTTESAFQPAKPFQNVTVIAGRPEIAYIFESADLMAWGSSSMDITNLFSTNRISLIMTNSRK